MRCGVCVVWLSYGSGACVSAVGGRLLPWFAGLTLEVGELGGAGHGPAGIDAIDQGAGALGLADARGTALGFLVGVHFGGRCSFQQKVHALLFGNLIKKQNEKRKSNVDSELARLHSFFPHTLHCANQHGSKPFVREL